MSAGVISSRRTLTSEGEIAAGDLEAGDLVAAEVVAVDVTVVVCSCCGLSRASQCDLTWSFSTT